MLLAAIVAEQTRGDPVFDDDAIVTITNPETCHAQESKDGDFVVPIVAMLLILQGIVIMVLRCALIIGSRRGARQAEALRAAEVQQRSVACQSQCTYNRKLAIPRFAVLPDSVQG